MGLLTVSMSDPLILMPAFGTLFFLLSCCVQLQYDGLFCFIFYISFCHIWLLSLLFCNERYSKKEWIQKER